MADALKLRRPDRGNPEPLWHQTESAIRELIESGEWPAGLQIPSEERLCELFGVSRITLRHAQRNLEEAGLLRREHGRGTFVRSPALVAGMRRLTSFTEEMRNLALTASSRLIEARAIPADENMAERLEIPEGATVVQLRRLRLGNGLPIAVQTAYLPAARVPGLIENAASVGSLYTWLRENCGIQPTLAREVYRVGRVSEADAALLEQPAGAPAFEVERLTSDARGPFERACSTLRADRYEIRSTLRI